MTHHSIVRANKENLTFAPSLMAQISMFPVSKPTTSYVERTNGQLTVRITPSTPDKWVYGKVPRLIFLYIQSMIATKHPDVDAENRTVTLRGAFAEFCRKTGLARNESTAHDVAEMLVNLAEIHIAVERGLNRKNLTTGDWEALSTTIANKVRNNTESKELEISIQFSDVIWDELCATSIPMDMNVIANLGKSARAIDVYIWCRYRLNGVQKTRRNAFITWESLFDQFESSAMQLKEFRRKFKFALNKVLELCPKYVIICDDKGVTIPYAENKGATPETYKSEFDNGEVIDSTTGSDSTGSSNLVDAKTKIMFDQLYDSLGLYRDAQYSRKLRVFAEQLENGLSPNEAFVISLR